MRYGDDFIVVYPARRQVYQMRKATVEFLQVQLNLSINPKNDVTVACKDGLKFLGHVINDGTLFVDKNSAKSVLDKVNNHNIASYRSLYLEESARKQLDWLILEKMLDI